MATGKVKRAFRLMNTEKEFLNEILDKATRYVKVRDTLTCCEYARRLILGDKKVLQRATAALRPIVMAKIVCVRDKFFKRLLERHANFLALPKPLQGKKLLVTASELGLLTRVKMVKVCVATIKQECQYAPGRLKMKMHDEIGRDCTREVVHKRKKKDCIQKIVDLAQQTGVADLTLVALEGFLKLQRDNVESGPGRLNRCLPAAISVRLGHSRTDVFVTIPHLRKRNTNTDELEHICHQYGGR